MKEHFGDVLDEFLRREERSPDQLSRWTNIPRQTIISWRTGAVKKPRHVEPILQLAIALKLLPSEVDRLITAAGHRNMAELTMLMEEKHDEKLQKLLSKIADLKPEPKTFESTPFHSPFQAPLLEKDLIGRSNLVPDLANIIQGNQTIFILHGMGGVGKSTLANHLAHHLRNDFPDGVLWINLLSAVTGQQLNKDVILSALAGCIIAFGRDVRDATTIEARSAILREILARKKVLLVLDNAHGSADAEPFLPANNSCKVLITSRNQRLLKNHNPKLLPVSSLEDHESWHLLSLLVGEERLNREKNATNQIIAFLGGLPLAITIIGGDLADNQDISLAEYVDLFGDETDRLEYLEDWEDASKNIRATFSLSFNHLPKAEQMLFAFLSLFDGPDFGADAVIAIIENEPPAKTKRRLSHLQQLSLIEPKLNINSREKRYQMHPLVRDFAREKLLELVPDPGLEERYTKFFADFVEHHQQQTKHTALEQDWFNIYKAIDLGLRHNSYNLVGQLISNLTMMNLGVAGFLDASGRWVIALELLETALHTLTDEHDSTEEKSRLLMCLGAINVRLHRFDIAQNHLRESLALIKRLPAGDKHNLLKAQISEWIAQILTLQDVEEALDWSRQGIKALEKTELPEAKAENGYLHIRHGTILARALGDLSQADKFLGIGIGLLNDNPSGAVVSGLKTLGIIQYLQGNSEEALKYWERGAEVAKRIGDHGRLLGLQQNITVYLSNKGYFHRTIKTQESLKEAYNHMGDIAREALMWSNLGEDYTLIGDFEKAEAYLGYAGEIAVAHNLPEVKIRSELNKAQLALWGRQLDKANQHLQQVMQMNHQVQLREVLPETASLRIWLKLLQKRYEEAVQLASQTLKSELDNREEGRVRRWLGWGISALDKNVEAEEEFEKSITVLAEEEALFELGLSQEKYGEYLLKMRQHESGQQYLKEAYSTFQTLNLTFHMERIQQTIL